MLTVRSNWQKIWPVSWTNLYSKLYILIELNRNDLNFISIDRQKLDLSNDVYQWYQKLFIYRDTTRFYKHKNAPRNMLPLW